MPKTGLKTFVYSFCISLFTIFTANGVYWHGRPSDKGNIRIPTKNITLFLHGEPANPSKRSVPVKKIALNVLPEIQKKNENPQIVYQPEDNGGDEIILADNTVPFAEIPLEFDTPEVLAEISESSAPAIMSADAGKISAPPSTAGERQQNVQLAPANEKQPEKMLLAAIPLEKGASVSQPAAAVKVAAHEPTPLFPLEKSNDAAARDNKIRIGTPESLNKVALADKNVPILSMGEPSEKKPTEKADTQARQWQSMAEKKPDAESPWIVAKGAAAPKNGMVPKQGYYQKEEQEISQALNPQPQGAGGVKVAAGTVKNLLIPIPEDILNEEDLTPQLVYPPQEGEANKIQTEQNITAQETVARKEKTEPSKTASKEDKGNILSSLNSIFSSAEKNKQVSQKSKKEKNFFDGIAQKLSPKEEQGKIMPTEMRLSFQPNRAEISGQTLRWIQAFAAKAANDNNTAIEIRIDGTSSMRLQQKRLNLLHNILTNKGVEYSKINTVFTDREPNSFIIRTVTRSNFNQGNAINTNNAGQGYYLQW